MFLFDFFRSFLPLHNPIGFGAADFIELALASALVLLLLSKQRIIPLLRALAHRTRWCMLFLFFLPIALRMALLPRYPAPFPSGADDFSYLLLADTLTHLRLANAVHPLHRFFEAIFVLQQPSYSSIFPLGQGMVLAIGQTVFHHPWAGVLLSEGAFCALCFWMLRGWTAPPWALLGGLFAVAEFGPLCKWMNDYWSGALSACAGCLVFGALPRLRDAAHTARNSALLGLGVALQQLTRPFECVLLIVAAALFVRNPRWRMLTALAAILPAIGLTLLQNKQVTGHWNVLPYSLSRYEYGVPATFTFQPNPAPHRPLTAEQQLDYEAQRAVHGTGPETLSAYLNRFLSRLSFYRFFFLIPLLLAIPAFIVRRGHWPVILAILIFALGTNFYPYFYPHYIAAEACLFLLVSVAGLKILYDRPFTRDLARIAILLSAAHFLFWYGVHLTANENIRIALVKYENWDFIDFGDPEGRIAIDRQLARLAGSQLVFVRYWPQHRFHEWIHNAADIDRARIVWAADLGPDENRKLLNYYPGRSAWLLEPDARPPHLTQYR